MRVTKLIKEYITKEVYKRLPLTDLPEYTSALNARADMVNEFSERWYKYGETLAAELAIKYNVPTDMYCFSNDGYSKGLKTYHSGFPLHHKNCSHRDAISEKRSAAIENILISLELGGTKNDLDKMLAEIKVE